MSKKSESKFLTVNINTAWAGDESIRPFVVEALMNEAEEKGFVSTGILLHLSEHSTCDSPLWLKRCATLSSTATEFGKFMEERAQDMLKWHERFHEVVRHILKDLELDKIRFKVTGANVPLVFDPMDREIIRVVFDWERDDDG